MAPKAGRPEAGAAAAGLLAWRAGVLPGAFVGVAQRAGPGGLGPAWVRKSVWATVGTEASWSARLTEVGATRTPRT